MDAASPSLELLPDLPLEEPLDLDLSPPPAPAAAAPRSAGAAAQADHAGLDFIDPEMFLAPGQESPIVAPSAPAVLASSGASHELTLEDPVVDELLSNPPPAPAPRRDAPPAAARVTAPPTPRAPAPKAAAPEPVQPLPYPVPPPAPARSDASATARVPILRTPSLSAAASKLAAATAASQRPRSGAPAPAPAAPPAGGAALATPVRPVPAAAAAAPAPARPAAGKPAPAASPAPAAKSPLAPQPAVSKPAPKPAIVSVTDVATVNAASPPSTATAAQAASDGMPMDQDFITRNQVVERYLAGRLPVKGATDFERFCKENPQLLDQIGLPERVNAGLRLLEASGKPEPWVEGKHPVWQKPQVTLALAAVVIALGIALAIVTGGSVSKSNRIVELIKEVHDRVLDPATSTRDIRLLPSRAGPSSGAAITIGGLGAGAQLADFRIDESRSPYRAFKITIDRVDQGRVGIINNVEKDSNGHLRIALNSSALGPGNYQLTLEGLDWRGEPQPDSWITIGISR